MIHRHGVRVQAQTKLIPQGGDKARRGIRESRNGGIWCPAQLDVIAAGEARSIDHQTIGNEFEGNLIERDPASSQ